MPSQYIWRCKPWKLSSVLSSWFELEETFGLSNQSFLLHLDLHADVNLVGNAQIFCWTLFLIILWCEWEHKLSCITSIVKPFHFWECLPFIISPQLLILLPSYIANWQKSSKRKLLYIQERCTSSDVQCLCPFMSLYVPLMFANVAFASSFYLSFTKLL